MAVFRTSQRVTAWLLALVLLLSLLQQAAVAFVQTAGGTDLKKTTGQERIGLTSISTENIRKTLLNTRHRTWSEGSVERPSKDPFLPLQPNTGTADGSGDGSGLQENVDIHAARTPSTGVLEMSMFILDSEARRDSPPPPAVPQKLTQSTIHDEDIMIMKRSVQSATPVHTTSLMNTHGTNISLTTSTMETVRENDGLNTTPSSVLFEIPAVDGIMRDVGTTPAEKVEEAKENKQASTTTGLEASGTLSHSELQPLQPVTNQSPNMTDVVPELPESLDVDKNQKTTVVLDAKLADDHKPVWFGGIFGPFTEKGLSDASGPCALGLGPCVFPTSPNGSLLQWEDLRRTLAFAWELHVFGSAVFFLFVVGGAICGLTSGSGMCHPVCGPLTLANALLLLAGLLRFVQFVVDPYGTRHFLPRPVLAALYNLPLTQLLWAQVTLALLVFKGTRLNFLTPAFQRPQVTGGLAAVHCASLMAADLLSHTLSPALPLMLQTLSICWGLPLCLGILFRALTPLRPTTRTPIPRWGAYKRVEERARRVLIVCSLLGVLCCALQIHGLLWLYGLLGDWRRFGWGWWLGQFWARLLELAWSFSMLLLGSRAFWRPRGGHRRVDQGQGASGRSERVLMASCWGRVLKCLPAGPWRRQENAWADLLPNNLAKYKESRADFRKSVVQSYETTKGACMKESSVDCISLGVYNNSSYDPQSAPPWSHGLEWQERDCVLSLIEFDLCPPSPIELRRSIDNALHFGHLLGSMGSLFTPPPPSWTQSEVSTAPTGSDFATQTTPTHIAYRWALDAGSSPISPQRFSMAQQSEVAVLDPQTFLPPDITSERMLWERNSALPAVNEDHDWMSITSGDDITNL